MPHTAELQRQIEDLAMRLVVDDPAGEKKTGGSNAWLSGLERIQRTAAAEHARPVADAAAAMMEAIRAGNDVQQGMLCLQQALEEANQTAAKSPAQDPELMADFVLESREHLASIESQMLAIERNPSDSEALHSAFRAFHTIKGLAGFLELWEVQELSHDVEAVLDRARNAQLILTPPAIDVVLLAADYLRRWLAHVERQLAAQPSEAPVRDEALLARIRAAGEGEGQTAEGGTPAHSAEEVSKPEPVAAGGATTPQISGAPAQTMSVKVDTAKLDSLVDMAGELVIAQSLVRHDPELAALKNPTLQRKVSQLTRITAELQKTAMAMRMVPVGPLFRRMARLVRDLSRQFGKRVEMEMIGEEIELDRTIVEELADPLMHMVRNALDHGIEPPAERERQKKTATARLRLKAHHQAGHVVIEIEDDGRGLDRDRILAKAIERGVITSADGMNDSDVFNLIFEPGFSTAAQVTNVSGRGVGMDVVRRHIEKLRGRVEIRSTRGTGTTFLLKVPLTLAIIDGLVVGVGTERFIVPLFAIRELFRPGEETVWTVRQSAEMALVRGTLLPVVRLYRRFNLTPRSEEPRDCVLVVAEAEGQAFCLLVDEVIGKQEVVIKALGETFASIQGIAGGAILGDGRVGLILEMEKLFKDRTN
jgi:two-component system chemotaxis sensor kinase CheA